MAWTWSKEGPGGGALTVVVRVTHPAKKRPAKGQRYLIFMSYLTAIVGSTQIVAREPWAQPGSRDSDPSFWAWLMSLETRMQAMSRAGSGRNIHAVETRWVARRTRRKGGERTASTGTSKDEPAPIITRNEQWFATSRPIQLCQYPGGSEYLWQSG